VNTTNMRGVDADYITNVYQKRRGNIRYRNSEVPGAVTAVPRNVFTSAQPVGPHRVILPHQGGVNFRAATTAAPAILPMRQSVLGAHAGRNVRRPPRAIIERPVVARLAPPRAPVSFAREQAAIRANGGRPLPARELARMRPNTPAAPVRLARPAAARPGLELRTAPQTRGGMSARERMLQQPALPPARPPRNDRPPWAQGRPAQPGTAVDRPRPQTFAPQQRPAPQRQSPLEWRSPAQRPAAPPRQVPEQRPAPPARQIPETRFAPPARQIPEQRFAPPARQTPEQRFAPPARQTPEQRFTPPARQVPEQRFAPAPRQSPEQRFTPPERQIPQQRVAQPSDSPPPARAPMPRAAPERPPARQPEGRPPSAPHPRAEQRVSFTTGDVERWQSPPPRYRAQENTIRYARPPEHAEPTGAPYRPPVSPPPMYRPVPDGSAAARALPLGSARLVIKGLRGVG
ncbi:MAG TPA: hypothetical protein VHE11_12290, partial [Steroidobacteraceae bacterium]|nr:hypothetical protein [Steroidobacteraceae bacterium]